MRCLRTASVLTVLLALAATARADTIDPSSGLLRSVTFDQTTGNLDTNFFPIVSPGFQVERTLVGALGGEDDDAILVYHLPNVGQVRSAQLLVPISGAGIGNGPNPDPAALGVAGLTPPGAAQPSDFGRVD